MISKIEAIKIAREIINEHQKFSEIPFALCEQQTETIKAGWVFFYNSEEFIRTGELTSQLLGNCPIFITHDGEAINIPTYENWQTFLKNRGYL